MGLILYMNALHVIKHLMQQRVSINTFSDSNLISCKSHTCMFVLVSALEIMSTMYIKMYSLTATSFSSRKSQSNETSIIHYNHRIRHESISTNTFKLIGHKQS